MAYCSWLRSVFRLVAEPAEHFFFWKLEALLQISFKSVDLSADLAIFSTLKNSIATVKLREKIKLMLEISYVTSARQNNSPELLRWQQNAATPKTFCWVYDSLLCWRIDSGSVHVPYYFYFYFFLLLFWDHTICLITSLSTTGLWFPVTVLCLYPVLPEQYNTTKSSWMADYCNEEEQTPQSSPPPSWMGSSVDPPSFGQSEFWLHTLSQTCFELMATYDIWDNKINE